MLRKALGLMMLAALLMTTASAQQPGSTAPPKTQLKVGDNAPDFTLKGVNGKEVKLSRLKGKTTVVLAFYPKAFTGGCTKEMKAYQADIAKFEATGAKVFGISTDDL